jgi:3-methyladenine DNA glycosylase AlkD
MFDLARLVKELKSRADSKQAVILQRFFKTGPGQYGAGDVFLGLKVPLQRQIARRYATLDLKSIQALLNSKFHEFRLVGLLILIAQYQAAADRKAKSRLVNFYLKNTRRINNWDLVDLSVYKILGDYLWLVPDKKPILSKLAISANLWERRLAMIATYAFIQKGRAEEALTIAKKLLKDEHDLMHKAVGWMLREVGKRVSEKKLTAFLDQYSQNMPRTALRYAVERLSPKQKNYYLKK